MNLSRDNASQVHGTVFHTKDHQVIMTYLFWLHLYLDEREPFKCILRWSVFSVSLIFPFVLNNILLAQYDYKNNLAFQQSFSPLALLAWGLDSSSLWRAVPCSVEGQQHAWSLPTRHQQQTLSSCDNPTYLQTLPVVFWGGQNRPCLGTTVLQ